MRKLLLSLGVILFGQTFLLGQIVDIENNAEVRAQIESIFEHLDKSRIPTGLLRDYSTDLVDYSAFDGTLNDSNIANLTTYEYILRSVRTSSVTSTFPFASVSEIMKGMQDATTATSVPISVAAFKYNYVVDDAVSGGLLQRVGDQVYDVYDSDQNWVNPYQDAYVIAFAPSVENFAAGSYTFTSGNFTYTNLNISSIELDAGDGRGYRSLMSGVTVYLSGGERILKLRMTLDDGTVLYAHSQIFAEEVTMHPLSNEIPPDFEKLFTESTAGGTISASISIRYALGRTSISKPFIVVEGFDPIELSKEDTSSVYFGKGRTTLKGIMPNLKAGITNDYDVIYVDWYNSEADIRLNAKLLIQIINWVNENNTGSDGNVIMGQSMGGLIARYALCSMESNRIRHNVVTFISHDVPYLGVNVPVGAQFAITDLIKNVYRRKSYSESLFKDVGYYVWLAEKYLHSTSARQMLLAYVDENGNLDSSEHGKWQAMLKQIGFPKGDPDLPIRNIAIANGGSNDFRADTLAHFYGYTNLKGIEGFLVSAFFGNLGGVLNSMLIGKRSNVTIDINIFPYENSGCKVYSSLVKYRKKLKWFGWNVSNTLYSKTKNAPTGASNFGYDKANGSFLPIDKDVLNELRDDLDALDTLSISMAEKVLFVPTASALCIGSDNRVLYANDYCSSYIGYSGDDTPFASVYVSNGADPEIYNHIKLDTSMCNWIVNNLRCKLVGPICPKENDRYAVNNCTEPVQWSTSDSKVATIDASGKVHILKAGFVTIKANYLGIRDSMRVMTGLPEFTLSSEKNISLGGYSVSASCSVSGLSEFMSKTNFHGCWGVKYPEEDIVWSDDRFLIFDKNGQRGEYSIFVQNGSKNVNVYFKAQNDAFVGKTSMIVCTAVPVMKPIKEPIIIIRDGTLVSDSEAGQIATRSQSQQEMITYCIDDKLSLLFDHIPTAAEFCERLAKSENFMNMLKEMKPWGDLDSIILKVRALTGKEEYEGTLRFIYKETI